MALLPRVEAAMKLGISIELLNSFHKKCPKSGETRTLNAKEMEGELYFEQSELDSYRQYLNSPWPHKKDKRPPIPAAIEKDIKEESHLCCAICGDANNGEVAHIEAVADSLNNGPDNLIYLCPNHHTQYDLGFKPSSNITAESVQAAKLVKRDSRVRMLRYEANFGKLLHAVMATLRTLNAKLSSGKSPDLTLVYETEVRQLMQSVPDLVQHSEDRAREDREVSGVENVVERYAPNITKFVSGISSQSKPAQIRSAAQSVVNSVDVALIEIDEVDCPHCGGRGMVGLAGDLCKYCHGDCVVSHEEADAYDSDEIDDVLCPRCGGNGTTGLSGYLCAYCKGSCYVSHQELDEYDENEIDEVLCPRCGGKGTTGLSGDLCAYCKGSCYVTRNEAKEYDENEIDEVVCPRCGGNGTTGLVGDLCAYCTGSCYVTHQESDEYDENEIDEVLCPRCGGNGTTGLIGDLCAYCKGSCYVTQKEAKEYDKNEIDEVDCPHCGGRGTTGLRGSTCALCKGSCFVSRDQAKAYRRPR